MFRAISLKNRPVLVNLSVRVQSTLASTALDSDVELKNAKPFKDVPKMPALPLFGTLWLYLPVIGKYNIRKLHEGNRLKHQEYGDIVKEHITPFNKFLHLFNPADFEKVFRSDGKFPERQPIQTISAVVKEEKEHFNHLGILNTNGEEWWAMRSKVQPHMLKPRTTMNYLPGIDTVAKDFVERMGYLRDPKSLEINNYADELIRYALETVGYVALDARLGCLSRTIPLDSDTKIILDSAGKVFDMIFILEFNSILWRFFETPRYRELKRTFRVFTQVCQKYLRESKLRIEKNPKDEKDRTILEQLLADNMDPKMLAIMINDLFLAGTDTTSNAAGFFFYHMCKNPEIQEKVYQEIKRLMPNKDSPITANSVNEARYLKACIKESMRLLPVAGGVVRVLHQDTVLSGYRVPAGTLVVLHTVTTSSSDKHFKNAKAFRPERWLRESKEWENPNPFATLPFGFGPRGCIGRRIAEQELYVLFMRVLRSYRLEYHYEDIGTYLRLASTPDKPLRFQFHDRA